jgi:hypothetical protein
MVANFAALGTLMGIQSHTGSVVHGPPFDSLRSLRAGGSTVSGPRSTVHGRHDDTTTPFRTPIRYLGGALGVAATGLLLLVLDIQVLHADDYVVKPHLSMQADGVRRYQYNQRVLDVTRLIPRGTIYDRRGFPLATTDAAVVLKSRDAFREVRAQQDPTCVEPIDRCYPLGGTAFHVLGDLTSRVNWGASNTSYLERDADARLRGFDDHATNVSSPDASGRPVTILRRDYRELVPFLRHRHNRNHPAVKRLLTRQRDLHTTLDARLQHRVAMILSNHAQRSATGKAAAVVLDADTGHVLAAASYPWPETRKESLRSTVDGPRSTDPRSRGLQLPEREVSDEADELLDRARYGLYPPGSTFKLVTAAAALRLGEAWSGKTFMCSLLHDGRVGAQIPGWSRPVRDDVLAKHAHGKIDMHHGMVHSCNAYFAQLAVRLGPKPLLETASRLGISVTPANSEQGLSDTLAQAGYGQGDVVATPIRMARVAAAIASRGVLREARLEAHGSSPAATEPLLPAAEAARLGRYMRDAVISGSGRRLKDHPYRIAGKTGTGEVSRQSSHAWFVGFAPHGSAARKIAFAVII